ncbi:MAG: HipA domain-containing protein [Treponema sp.]|nr:HipA domain-containing protein [Treponema sp.]
MSRSLRVYLCGELAGTLIEDDLLQLQFTYAPKARPLSVRLAVREEPYPHALAFPFFENLSPEGEAFEILTHDHESGNTIFSLLDRFGGDCAGAIAFYETAPASEDAPLRELSPLEMVKIIDALPRDPLLTGLEDPPRLSLAGAQSKFAVLKSNGTYYRSNDRYPTTHIIKIANTRFPHLLENELFCMKLAQMVFSNNHEFNIPDLELLEIDGRPYLEISRYDRKIENTHVERIHQEDFCQALGLVSGKKYQKGGGARLRDCYEILNQFSRDLLSDISRFAEWIIFNYLIGNTDAHAKNISLLHGKEGIKLAPFYDLLSTEVYPESVVDHEMAMLINGKGTYSSLKDRDFIALFEHMNQNATNMMRALAQSFSDIVQKAIALKETLPSCPVYDEIIALVQKRMEILFTPS